MHTPLNNPLTPDEIDRLARRRVRAKMGWFFHATVYVLVNLFIFARSEYGFGTHSWHVAPLLGWGLGLAFHGISVWFVGAGSGFRERMVQRERERLQNQNNIR